MSYYINLHFKELKEDESILATISNLKEIHKKVADEIIKKNISFIPSIHRFDIWEPEYKGCEDLPSKYCEAIILADDKWINDLFTIKIFYWKKYNLIAVTTPLDELDGFKSIQFQNSCDQDYDREYWKGINLFEDIVESERKMSDEQFRNENDCGDITDLEYDKRTWIYKSIYEKLDLVAWETSRNSGVFQNININFINDMYEEARLSISVKEIRKEFLKKFMEESW